MRFRTEAQFENFKIQSGIVGLQDATDPDATVAIELEDLRDNAMYDVVSLGAGTVCPLLQVTTASNACS